jgi:hypothetical protein
MKDFLTLLETTQTVIITVVVISSVSHLGRGSTAAYARDIVKAASRIWEMYGRSVRVVHGFPLIGGGLVDENTVRGLWEIELWLAEVDKHRLGSLPDTSAYFINNFLSTISCTPASIHHRQAQRLLLHCTRQRVVPLSVRAGKAYRGPYPPGRGGQSCLPQHYAVRAQRKVHPTAGHMPHHGPVLSVSH